MLLTICAIFFVDFLIHFYDLRKNNALRNALFIVVLYSYSLVILIQLDLSLISVI